MSLCQEEPLQLVLHTTKNEQAGIEAYRRLSDGYDPLGPRAAKSLLHKILSTKTCLIGEVRNNIEQFERHVSEYKLQAGVDIQEEIRVVCLEQMLPEPLKTRVSLNSERLSSYTLLRAEVMRYTERLDQESKLRTCKPMDVDELAKGKGKGKSKGKGKGQVNGKDAPNPQHRPGKGTSSSSSHPSRAAGSLPQDVCARCGRSGHWKNECWAKKHKDGRMLESTVEKGAKGKNKGKKERTVHELGEQQEGEEEQLQTEFLGLCGFSREGDGGQDSKPPLPRRRRGIEVPFEGLNQHTEDTKQGLLSGSKVQIRTLAHELTSSLSQKAREAKDEVDKEKWIDMRDRMKEQNRSAGRVMSTRLAADLRAGRPAVLAKKKEESRRRAAEHRAAGVKRRAEKALEKESSRQDDREKVVINKGGSGPAEGVEEDEENEYEEEQVAKAPLKREKSESLSPPRVRSWRRPGWLVRRCEKKRQKRKDKKKNKGLERENGHEAKTHY